MEAVKRLLQAIFDKTGHQAYLVGGTVRNLLLGLPPTDFDITTSCPIEILKEHFSTREIGHGSDFGVIGVVFDGDFYEVAQFRADGDYDGRKPTSVNLENISLKDDSERRDLTINAMYQLHDGTVVDPQGGKEDLDAKLIRTVGSAQERFDEDPVRILRAITFASRLDFNIAEDTSSAIKANVRYFDPDRMSHFDETNKLVAEVKEILKLKPQAVKGSISQTEIDKLRAFACKYGPKKLHIPQAFQLDCVAGIKAFNEFLDKLPKRPVASERVGKEIVKMASTTGHRFSRAIELLDEHGLLELILPELAALKGLVHNDDVHPEGGPFEHTMSALKTYLRNDSTINLAIALHDIGKAATYAFNNGRHTYFKHEPVGTDMVAEIAKRLVLSQDQREALMFSTKNHTKFHDLDRLRPVKVMRLVEDTHYNVLKEVAIADDICRGVPGHNLDECLARIQAAEAVAKEARLRMGPDLRVITGHDVMDIAKKHGFELKPGPQIGEIIDAVQYAVVDQGVCRSQIEDLVRQHL